MTRPALFSLLLLGCPRLASAAIELPPAMPWPGPWRPCPPPLPGRSWSGSASATMGQLEYVEHYRAKLELESLQNQLTQRFGSPDAEEKCGQGVTWGWRQGERRLQVEASNQVDEMRRGAGFRSRLAVALWNEAYDDYLQEANRRCSRIRAKPQSEPSMADGIFVMKHHCSLVEGSTLEPGLGD